MVFTEDYEDDSSELIDGRKWLDCIQETIETCVSMWNIHIGDELRQGLVGYVIGATDSDGRELVLKLRDPGRLYRRERFALQHFNGEGVVPLVASAEKFGALLLERAVPGVELGDLVTRVDSNEAVVSIINALHFSSTRPAAGDADLLPDVSEQGRTWWKSLVSLDGPCPIDEARRTRAQEELQTLINFEGECVVVHGDLHVGNVVQCDNGWVSLDPKGFRAPVEFDAAWWLSNPPMETIKDPVAHLTARLDSLVSTFGFDRELLLTWARAFVTVRLVSRCRQEIFWDANHHARALAALDAIE